MKKMNRLVTAEEMTEEANTKTDESYFDAQCEREKEWNREIGPYYGEKEDYASKGVFMDAIRFFASREQEVRRGEYTAFAFSIRSEVKKILAFDFNFDYDRYSWDEKTFDPDDPKAFDTSMESDELPQAFSKREVVAYFRRFLLMGAVQAKKIESDTYPLWRRLLTDFEYVHGCFENGAEKKEIDAYFTAFDDAAKKLSIDSEVMERLDMTESAPKGKKAKKRGGRGNFLSSQKRGK